jgi:hypothetical protein
MIIGISIKMDILHMVFQVLYRNHGVLIKNSLIAAQQENARKDE